MKPEFRSAASLSSTLNHGKPSSPFRAVLSSRFGHGESPVSYRLSQATAGGALVTVGLGAAWLMHAFPARLNVPPLIGYVAALAFIFAGLLAFCNAFGGARARAWLAVTLLVFLVVPGIWLAFGSGHRQCSFGSFYLFGLAQGAVCRVAFGVASAAGLGVIAFSIRHALGLSRGS